MTMRGDIPFALAVRTKRAQNVEQAAWGKIAIDRVLCIAGRRCRKASKNSGPLSVRPRQVCTLRQSGSSWRTGAWPDPVSAIESGCEVLARRPDGGGAKSGRGKIAKNQASNRPSTNTESTHDVGHEHCPHVAGRVALVGGDSKSHPDSDRKDERVDRQLDGSRHPLDEDFVTGWPALIDH